MNTALLRTAAVGAAFAVLAACGSGGEDASGEITVYSGRSENLVGPLLERFETRTGIQINARYGDTAELATTIVEEGASSPADVFFAQDAGALGALQSEGRFAPLPQAALDRVPAEFRSAQGRWVGTSGRVRVAAYNPTLVEAGELPRSIEGFTAARWKGKIGWAPRNGSFQVFVTAFRTLRGDAAARAWLRAIRQNDAKAYESNDAIAEAIAEGEIEVGFVNHYYPFEIREENPGANVVDHFFEGGDVGGLVNVAGVGMLQTSARKDLAARFVEFLLSDEAQRFFVEESFEYALVPGFEPHEGLPDLDELEAPAVDLSALGDLRGTLALLEDVGLI